MSRDLQAQSKMRHRVSSDSIFSSESHETCRDRSRISFKHEGRERISYLENQIKNIEATKKTFLETIYVANRDIENMMRNLYIRARNREQELKSQLREIGRTKVLEWDRQLKLCEEAEQKLKNIKGDFFKTLGEMQFVFNFFLENLGFIDSGEIKFEERDESVLKNLLNFGVLSFGGIGKSHEILNPKFGFGDKGKNVGEFYQPWGVCTDSVGHILVADRGNDRIQAFNGCGEFLYQFGKSGSGPGEFNCPTGIAADKKCRIIVSDEKNHRIQIFSFTGRFLNTFGEKGSKAGQFQNPWDVSVSENDEIAVSDYSNCRIQLFNSCGSFLNQFLFDENIPQPKPGVCHIGGVAFKPDGSLLVTNSCCVLQIHDNFTKVSKVGSKTSEISKCKSIACNSQGMFIVADGSNNNVQVFDKYGNLIRSFDLVERNSRGLASLGGVSFLSDRTIALTDSGNHRILVFEF